VPELRVASLAFSKLGPRGWCIETVRGTGYRFRADPKNGAGPAKRSRR